MKKEMLDTYTEDHVFVKEEDRNIVHQEGLWHDTVHCWLYDKEGNIYFQIRADEGTYYTTASGHVSAGETIEEAFVREINEEIGIDVREFPITKVKVVKFKLDKVKKDGSLFIDRAFANVHICEFDNELDKFNFDLEEIKGLIKVNALEVKELLFKEDGFIDGEVITLEGNKYISNNSKIYFKDFLINPGETGITKYGEILDAVIEATK